MPKARVSVRKVNVLQMRYNELKGFQHIFNSAVSDCEIHFGGDCNRPAKLGTYVYMSASTGFAVMRDGIGKQLNEELLALDRAFEELGLEPIPYVSETNKR